MTEETSNAGTEAPGIAVPAELAEPAPFRLDVPTPYEREHIFEYTLRFLRDGDSWNRTSAEDFNFQSGKMSFCVGGAIAKAATGMAGMMNLHEKHEAFNSYLTYANYAGRVLQEARGLPTDGPDRAGQEVPYFYPYVSHLVTWNDGLTSHEWPLLRGLLEACRDGRSFDLNAARESLGSLA